MKNLNFKTLISFIALITWASFTIYILNLFYHYDWGYGVLRGLLLLILFFLIIAFEKVVRHKKFLLLNKKYLEVVGKITIIAGVLIYISIGTKVFLNIRKSSEIPLDQGQNSYRATQTLLQLKNPYSTSQILDPVSYKYLRKKYKSYDFCFASHVENFEIRWKEGRIDNPSRFFPNKELDGCQKISKDFTNLGYKYGPLLLLTYLPFFLVFGKAGISIAHSIYLIILVFIIIKYYRSSHSNPFSLIITVAILFIPYHLRINVFQNSASDLLPVLFLVACLYYLKKKNYLMTGIFSGLSISTKFLPGILTLPLFLSSSKSRKGIPALLIAWGLINSSFFLWSPTGYLNNLVLFNFKRPTDSTSLMHYLSSTQGKILIFLVILALIFFFNRLIRKNTHPRSLQFIIIESILLFSISKVFHNNYLVWILPIIGMYTISLLKNKAGRERIT